MMLMSTESSSVDAKGGTMPVDAVDVAQLARAAKALSDPIRLKMLGMLGEGRTATSCPISTRATSPARARRPASASASSRSSSDLGSREPRITFASSKMPASSPKRRAASGTSMSSTARRWRRRCARFRILGAHNPSGSSRRSRQVGRRGVEAGDAELDIERRRHALRSRVIPVLESGENQATAAGTGLWSGIASRTREFSPAAACRSGAAAPNQL